MKIIALGDIHGNLPAFEVALREARAEGCDVLYHTGDLVGYAPFPEETVALVRAQKIPGVRGNLDESVAAGAEDFGPDTGEPGTMPFRRAAYQWTLRNTHALTRNYLADLPFEERFDTGNRRVVVLHGSPIDSSTALAEDRDDDFFREAGDLADADVIIVGHTHRPYHRVVDGRHFVNAGSVGAPGDHDPRTGYVVIQSNGNIEVQFRRFPYDLGRVTRAAAARRFPAPAPPPPGSPAR